MPATRLVAVDVAILLPSDVAMHVARLNAGLQPPPHGFLFDESHLPHLTLVQQFVRHDRLETLYETIADVLRGTPPLALRTTTVGRGRTASTLRVEPSTALVDLHRHLMDRLAPFACDGGGADAFHTNGEPPRPGDVDWVTRFRTRSADVRYEPHITLGVGDLATAVNLSPLTFTASRVAACHLGRFCTCRVVFVEWTLTAAP